MIVPPCRGGSRRGSAFSVFGNVPLRVVPRVLASPDGMVPGAGAGQDRTGAGADRRPRVLRTRLGRTLLAGLASGLLAFRGGDLLAQSAAPPSTPPAEKKPAPAKKKSQDPFTPAQRRELERLLRAEREALEEEREAVAAAAKRLQAESERLEKERAELDARKAAIDVQSARVEALAKELELQKARLDEVVQSIPTLVQPSKEIAERLAKLEESSKRKPDLPPEVVSAGDFPGSIRVPGSPAAIKFGGAVWVSAVSTLDALGSDDRFLTFSIPVTGDPGVDKGPRTSFWANPSKLNFDARTKGPGDRTIRAFIEGDFAGPSNGFRLRHAYFQVGRFLAGQTWSTFSDPDADNGDIDFEGVNAENVKRQAQFRYTQRVSPIVLLAASIEYPYSSLTDANGSVVQGVNQVPDLIARGTWTPSEGMRLQGAAVLRSIRGESEARPNETQHATGWGLSASGTLSALSWAPADEINFQVNGGEGIARFINDLDSAGGQDGAFEPATGDLHLLSHWGWYGSYLHRWHGSAGEPGDLRSSLIWGAVRVANLDFQPQSAYRRTNRLSLNVVWTPFRKAEFGAQYIWGQRINRDGAQGEARQLQLRARYLF